jgi:hypothetical protein
MGWSGRAPAQPASEAGRGSKVKEHAMSQKFNSAIAVVGIDIGKNSFHVVGHDKRGAIVLRQKWSRGQVQARLANLPPCLIGMEACVGAHHLSRKLQALGHDARLMPAKYVRPYSAMCGISYWMHRSPYTHSDFPGSLTDQPLAHPVQRLHIELVGGLRGGKFHGRALHCLGNRFGIAEVVLLALTSLHPFLVTRSAVNRRR